MHTKIINILRKSFVASLRLLSTRNTMNWRRAETDQEPHAGPAAESARTTTAETKAQKWTRMAPSPPDPAGAPMGCHTKNSQCYPAGWIEWNILLAA